MRTWLISSVVVLASVVPAYAIKVTLFDHLDSFLERSREIVVTKCLAVSPEEGANADGLYPAEVDITHVVKGKRKLGKARIATIYDMSPGKTYLLSSLGGSAYDTDFLPQLSCVEIPDGFDFGSLKGSPRDRVESIFAARRAQVEQGLRRLQEEKSLLDRAVVK